MPRRTSPRRRRSPSPRRRWGRRGSSRASLPQESRKPASFFPSQEQRRLVFLVPPPPPLLLASSVGLGFLSADLCWKNVENPWSAPLTFPILLISPKWGSVDLMAVSRWGGSAAGRVPHRRSWLGKLSWIGFCGDPRAWEICFPRIASCANYASFLWN